MGSVSLNISEITADLCKENQLLGLKSSSALKMHLFYWVPGVAKRLPVL